MPHMTDTCPKCNSENVYFDGSLWICPDCAHEWIQEETADETAAEADGVIRDANGNELQDGDSVIVLKELKIRGASGSVKSGTKVRNIRLDDLGDGHNIACRIDGIGSLHLKSEFVRKA